MFYVIIPAAHSTELVYNLLMLAYDVTPGGNVFTLTNLEVAVVLIVKKGLELDVRFANVVEPGCIDTMSLTKYD